MQRFREGFTRLPPLARIGELYRRDHAAGIAMAEQHAIVMASEVRACDIDISFAPVVDLVRGNRVIAERAFDPDPQVVAELGAVPMVPNMKATPSFSTSRHVASTVFGGEKPSSSEIMLSLRPLTPPFSLIMSK